MGGQGGGRGSPPMERVIQMKTMIKYLKLVEVAVAQLIGCAS